MWTDCPEAPDSSPSCLYSMGIFAPHAGQATKQTLPGEPWGGIPRGRTGRFGSRWMPRSRGSRRELSPRALPLRARTACTGAVVRTERERTAGETGRARMRKSNRRPARRGAGGNGRASHLSDRYGRPSAPVGGGPGRADPEPYRSRIRRPRRSGRPDCLNPIHRPGQTNRSQVTPDSGGRRSTGIRPGTRGPGKSGRNWSEEPRTSGSSPPCR